MVGNLIGRRAGGLAVGRSAPAGQPDRTVVFVAEDTGLTELEPNADDVPTAQPSRFTVDVAATSISALAYDLKRDDLYVGMAAGTVGRRGLRPSLPRQRRVAAEYDWVTGYSMIGGLFVRPDGVVYVLDDPALLDPAEPIGTGRMFHVGLPAAHVGGGQPGVRQDGPARVHGHAARRRSSAASAAWASTPAT